MEGPEAFAAAVRAPRGLQVGDCRPVRSAPDRKPGVALKALVARWAVRRSAVYMGPV